MEDPQNDALLERVPSAETLTQPRRNSNAKAFKVAGLTVLACLLLAGQALTAYLLLGQKDHITALEQGQEKLKTQFLSGRSSAVPKKMHMAMNSMPMLTALTDDESPKQKVALKKLQPTSFLREGSGLVDGTRLLQPMDTLPLLTDIEDVKEPDGSESPAVEVEPKCKLEAERQIMPGVFKPQCDEQGNYLPMQCWHSTGYCWCVDKNGKPVEGTKTRGRRPHCGGVNSD